MFKWLKNLFKKKPVPLPKATLYARDMWNNQQVTEFRDLRVAGQVMWASVRSGCRLDDPRMAYILCDGVQYTFSDLKQFDWFPGVTCNKGEIYAIHTTNVYEEFRSFNRNLENKQERAKEEVRREARKTKKQEPSRGD